MGVRSTSGADATRSGRWLGVWNSATTSYYLLLISSISLVILGLIMVLSASSVESLNSGGSAYGIFQRQAMFAVLGGVIMVVAARVPTTWVKKNAALGLVLGIAMQSLVLTPLGVSRLGNTNWIQIPGTTVTLQPSEFMKVALCVFLGTAISRKLMTSKEWIHVLLPSLTMSAFAVGFVILGNDLGTAMVYILMIAGALLVADIPMKWFASAGAIAAIVVAILALVSDNRMGRIMATYDSQCDSSDLCYQVTRGLEALGSGGLTGVGLGASSEKWAYLPEAQNDFIFAIIGEELGFLGALLVIVLFAALGIGMMRVVIRHEDPMVKISTAAIAAWILGQAIFNIGVVTRIFPVIGVPLPFVSAGGSALIATMLAIGLVLGFARTEPGAHDAFARKPSVVRKTAAIVARSTRSISRRS